MRAHVLRFARVRDVEATAKLGYLYYLADDCMGREAAPRAHDRSGRRDTRPTTYPLLCSSGATSQHDVCVDRVCVAGL